MSRFRDPHTADLLAWQPPEPIQKFEPAQVRAATIDQKICKAMKVALKESVLSRGQIAEEMGDFLGERISKAMLDAYVSPARDTHNISLTRFLALVHVTRDRRLLELLAELFGWCVVDERFAEAIKEVELAEKREEIDRQLQLARLRRRSGGR
jgi:hypothetical protein